MRINKEIENGVRNDTERLHAECRDLLRGSDKFVRRYVKGQFLFRESERGVKMRKGKKL